MGFNAAKNRHCAILSVGIAAVLSVSIVVGAASLSAASSQSSATVYVSAADQVRAEAAVRDFVENNPMPAFNQRGTDGDFRAFQEQLELYWETVPWEAVYAQWDCKITDVPTVSWSITGFGQDLVSLDEGHICADTTLATNAVGMVQTKSDYLDAAKAGSHP